MSPLGREKKEPSPECLISHIYIQANTVASVSSIITKIFNPSKYGQSQFNFFLLNDTLPISACIVSCRFLLFDAVLLFNSVFCSIQYFLFDSVLLFSIQIIQCSDPGNIFQVF